MVLTHAARYMLGAVCLFVGRLFWGSSDRSYRVCFPAAAAFARSVHACTTGRSQQRWSALALGCPGYAAAPIPRRTMEDACEGRETPVAIPSTAASMQTEHATFVSSFADGTRLLAQDERGARRQSECSNSAVEL